MRIHLALLFAAAGLAQTGNEKLGDLLQERALNDAVARLKTDERIAMFATLSGARPAEASSPTSRSSKSCATSATG